MILLKIDNIDKSYFAINMTYTCRVLRDTIDITPIHKEFYKIIQWQEREAI